MLWYSSSYYLSLLKRYQSDISILQGTCYILQPRGWNKIAKSHLVFRLPSNLKEHMTKCLVNEVNECTSILLQIYMFNKKGLGLVCQYSIICCQCCVQHIYNELAYKFCFLYYIFNLQFVYRKDSNLKKKKRHQEEEALSIRVQTDERGIKKLFKIILVFVFKKKKSSLNFL